MSSKSERRSQLPISIDLQIMAARVNETALCTTLTGFRLLVEMSSTPRFDHTAYLPAIRGGWASTLENEKNEHFPFLPAPILEEMGMNLRRTRRFC